MRTAVRAFGYPRFTIVWTGETLSMLGAGLRVAFSADARRLSTGGPAEGAAGSVTVR